MAFSSQKDVDKYHCDNNFSKSATLQTTDDYILSEFLDFPQFSPEVRSEDSLYFLKTEADCWENANQISKSTECNNSISKMNNASVGSLMKFCCADPYPEVKTNRDSDMPLHDTFLSDDLSALVFNTFDAFDYIDESESSVNMNSRCVETDFPSSKFSASSQCFSYIGGCPEDISGRSDHQGDSELENCHAEQLPSINCCSWQADNIHMNNLTSSQSNRFDTVETAVDEQANMNTENEGPIWSNWSVMMPEYDKNIPKGQSYGTNACSANTVMSVLKANVGACTSSQNNAYIPHLDNSSPPLTEVTEYKSESSNWVNVSELPPGARPVDNTQLVQKNGQSVHQREDIDSAFRKMTEISFVSMSEQTQLPFSADMTVDLWNAGSQCHELKNTTPVSNRMNTATEHQCTVHTEKHPSESINSSHFSDLQANRENNLHSLASQSETYMKVGKRGRYVALPAKNVNKLMVRELLCISGNKEEISIQDMTQDYRNNIRRILQQKHKRLNHLEC